MNTKDKSSNWAKVCADIVEDCSEDLVVALGKAARISEKNSTKVTFNFSKF